MNPEQFKKLQKQWYQVLAKDGFKDIERADEQLITNATEFGKRVVNEDYYRRAGWFLHEHNFENQTEKSIWEGHANGFTALQIAAYLKKNKLTILQKKVNFRQKSKLRINRNNVEKIINKLKFIMLNVHEWSDVE